MVINIICVHPVNAGVARTCHHAEYGELLLGWRWDILLSYFVRPKLDEIVDFLIYQPQTKICLYLVIISVTKWAETYHHAVRYMSREKYGCWKEWLIQFWQNFMIPHKIEKHWSYSTHWGLNIMANILQIMLSNTLYINKNFFKWKLLYYD